MPSTICAIVNNSSDTQNGRVVSRAMAKAPTMLLTAYQPLALTQFKRAGKYAPRRPKLWRVNESWGIPISGPMLAVSASKPHPMRFPTRMAITPSAKPRPKTIASAPTSQTGSPMLAESQSVNNVRGRPCRSLAGTCSMPCGSTVSTRSRYAPPTSTGFSIELTLLIDLSFLLEIIMNHQHEQALLRLRPKQPARPSVRSSSLMLFCLVTCSYWYIAISLFFLVFVSMDASFLFTCLLASRCATRGQKYGPVRNWWQKHWASEKSKTYLRGLRSALEMQITECGRRPGIWPSFFQPASAKAFHLLVDLKRHAFQLVRPALERLSAKKLKQAGLHRESCHRHRLVQILVSGELSEHAVRQICPGGKSSAYERFSHVIVSDGWRLKETRGPDNRPVKITVHHQRFHPLHICIQRPPNTVNNDRFEDFLKDETSPSIMVSSLRIGRTRTHTDKATNAVVVHGLYNMSRAL